MQHLIGHNAGMTVTGKDTWGGVAASQPRKDLPPPPHWRLEAVAATPQIHDLVVAPDGTTVAFILDRAELGSDVWVMASDGSGPTQLTVDREPAPSWEDTAPAFSPDSSTLAYVGPNGLRLVPVAGGPSRLLAEASAPVWLPDDRLVVSIDQDRLRSNARHPRSTEVSRLALLNPTDPWPHPITDPSADPAQATVSPDGTRVAFSWFPPDDRNRSDIVVVDVHTTLATTVASAEGSHAHSPAWSPDGSTIAFVSEEPGWYELFLVGSDGSGLRRLTSEGADLGSLRWSPDGATLLATRTRRGRTDLVTVTVADGSVTVLAAGGEWRDPRWLADGSVVAIFEDHATPPRVERIDHAGRKTIFDPAPAAVRSAPHVSPEEVSYRSHDGLEIHGFLFRPVGATPDQPVPAVIYPHGGPTSAYTDAWDGPAQYFLDKGYAWFAINFRGSTGYGRQFERANHHTWGVDDTGDCLAGADHLAGLGWVDPERIAIFGASYGSYLALCALAGDLRHRFACGVAKYGDCDILTSWAQGDRVGVEDLERQMSHPAQARTAYRAGSPIHRVEAIERPILVAHGEKDTRVSPQQSEQLVKALDRLGKTYEYVTYPTEGHGLLRRGPFLHFYRRLERFLDWYLL